MKAIAIVGSLFGDCGKGRLTHVFAAQSRSCLVARYNGGPQAGHTVVRDDGTVHIFHHHGSGALDGGATYLSQFFVANPLIWRPEHEDLQRKGGNVKLYVHPDTPLTTPYDMLINREAERARGANRHGSCGYGVNETVERLCKSPYRIFFRDLHRPDFGAMVAGVRDEYLPQRMEQLRLIPSENMREACASPKLYEEYIAACETFYREATPLLPVELSRWGTVIFEGSQGLCLDEEFRFFPHVTRSRTGLPNIMELCTEAGISELETVYVTRTYATRHGHGPLPTEVPGLSYEDRTNIENEWQGVIRFGHLDIDLIQEAVRGDLKKAGKLKVRPSLAITCMDQIGAQVDVQYQGRRQQIPRDDLPRILAKAIGAKQVYLSWKR